MLDLNELLVFARVVQAGSFTKAARALGMPKSSVSKKVADLEQRLGVRLLQRTTRKLGLTDAGRLYFQRAQRIVADVEEAEHAVADLESEPRGLLRVTAPINFSQLGPILASFLKRCPEVQVEMVCTDRVINLVEEGFDVAIRAGALHDSTLVARKLRSIRRVLMASPAYLKKRGTPRDPQDLEHHVCLAFGVGEAPNVWTMHKDGTTLEIHVRSRFTVNDFDILLEAARGGVGVASVPDYVAEEGLKRILPDWCAGETTLHAVYPTARHLSPKVVAFVDALRAGFAER